MVAIALGLIALTLSVYLRTLHNGFVSYDDYDYITNNPLVRSGLSWQSVAQAFSTLDQSNWFPLEWISLMATAQLFGLNPLAFHLTNLLVHAANVVLLFVLLEKATHKTSRAAIVAALFAVLPLNVEAVAWATERKSVLSVFFMLLTLAAYSSYARRPQPGRYALVAIFFALGLMTKAWLVPIPFALLLLDYWPLHRFGGPSDISQTPNTSFVQLVTEKIPLILMSLASAAITFYAARSGDALAISAAHAPLTLRVQNGLWSYLMYIVKAIWPAHLAIIYPFPQHSYALWQIAIAASTLISVSVLAWCYRERRYFIVGWLWYVGFLFPVIGLIQTGTQSMADRWAYVSFLGLFVAAVWFVADSLENLKLKRLALPAIAAAVIACYTFVSCAQAGYWKDNLTLYRHALRATKQNGPVHVNLGVEYERLQRPDLAIEEYRQAVLDTPNLGIAHYNLGRLLEDDHQLAAAAPEYKLAIANTGVPHEVAEAYVGLAGISAQQGRSSDAIQQYGAALRAMPTYAYALLGRGLIELREGDLNAAQEDFLSSTQIAPTPMTWYTLGTILEKEQKWPEAAQAYQEALRLNPNLVDAQNHLRDIRKELGY